MQKLEYLRREPLYVVNSNEVIPCHEESNLNLLCKHPLVSVMMLAYNHELYIIDAIESIVKQQCNFEFELIIGEDCSTDRTRALCLEYQKQYPTIIRVLWSDTNIGARLNSIRIHQHIRGKYCSICEGDDYWTSVTKLKRQVEILDSYNDVSIVYTDFDIVNADKAIVQQNVLAATGILDRWNEYSKTDFLTEIKFGYIFFATASIMVRSSVYLDFMTKEKVARQNLTLGDMGIRVFAAKSGAPMCLPENMVAYRSNETGITKGKSWKTNMLLLDSLYMRIALLKGEITETELHNVFQHNLVRYTYIYARHGFPYSIHFCWLRVLNFCLFNRLLSWRTFIILIKPILFLIFPTGVLTFVQKSRRTLVKYFFIKK